MIDPSRFLAESTDRTAWMAHRARGVTATEVAKASTPAGFLQAQREHGTLTEIAVNEYMQFGTDNEPWLSLWVKRETGIMPNRWLIAAETNPLHMATPDGLSLDHTRISEIKTGGTEINQPPLQHIRQMGWQFHTTDAEEGIYAFMLRKEVNGVMVPAWMEPRMWVIRRDNILIAELVETANRLLEGTPDGSRNVYI